MVRWEETAGGAGGEGAKARSTKRLRTIHFPKRAPPVARSTPAPFRENVARVSRNRAPSFREEPTPVSRTANAAFREKQGRDFAKKLYAKFLEQMSSHVRPKICPVKPRTGQFGRLWSAPRPLPGRTPHGGGRGGWEGLGSRVGSAPEEPARGRGSTIPAAPRPRHGSHPPRCCGREPRVGTPGVGAWERLWPRVIREAAVACHLPWHSPNQARS